MLNEGKVIRNKYHEKKKQEHVPINHNFQKTQTFLKRIIFFVITALAIGSGNFINYQVCSESIIGYAAEETEGNVSYTITPSSKPYEKLYTNYTTYNKYTKHYYVLRSYLEQLESVGGGTLVLTKGTYTITNTLYVPSNVTIQFEDGTVIKKGTKTGTTKFSASNSIFQMIAPSKSTKENVYGKYNGETNIKFIGTGTVIIDMKYKKDCVGLIFGHNTNITVSGITFQNMYSGHFIELDASKNVTIENNTFQNYKESTSGSKEAINIDTPDLKTEGFSSKWSKFDCTPNQNVLIQNNVFDNLERAIGTHKYSEEKYHNKVQILNNKISNIQTDAIRMMNWTNSIIEGNEIDTVVGEGDRAILGSGVKNPTICNNIFKNVPRSIQMLPWKNSDAGEEYSVTYNVITKLNVTTMMNNKLINVSETFIRINKTYGIFDADTDKHYYSLDNISYQ